MTDEEVIKYQTGFNEGYILAKYLPDLSNKLKEIKGDNPRLDGFRDGIDICILEKVKEHAPDWLKRDFSAKEDKSVNHSKEDKGKQTELAKE